MAFSKQERLRGEITISQLFKNGTRFKVASSNFSLNVLFFLNSYLAITEGEDILQKQGNSFVRVLLAVPKKQIKLAVNRNKAKRRLRESYRKNKDILSEVNKSLKVHSLFLDVGFTYRGNKVVTYAEIDSLVIKALQKLEKKLAQNNSILVQAEKNEESTKNIS